MGTAGSPVLEVRTGAAFHSGEGVGAIGKDGFVGEIRRDLLTGKAVGTAEGSDRPSSTG